jgi:hypothetical protein
MSRAPKRRDGVLKWAIGTIVVGVLLGVNLPTMTSAALSAFHNYEINSHGYEARNGHWSILKLPGRFRVNAIHAALLDTGKVLIIAGSGNDGAQFKAGKFKSIVWNPTTNKFKLIDTPSDMFCGGHSFLPDGKLLIAGGTKRYEVLADEVHRAAGVVTIQNQSPEGGPVKLPAGAEFVAPDGAGFRSTKAVVVPPASKTVDADGVTSVQAGEAELWVEAVQKGTASSIDKVTHLAIAGVSGARARNLFGITNSLTLDKQEYWGDDKSYLFNPQSESYEKVSDLALARWYPTLVGLRDGRVLAVSGLDQFGRIIQGKNEIYTPATKQWKLEPRLTRTLPTYPALFLMPSGNLFYSGSNAGYGSASVGRTPGIWNVNDNSFRIVPGLRDPDETETSGSVLLPPAQAQKYMIAGGGGVGDSSRSTARTAIADLSQANPHWTPGPSLAQPTRYPSMVITPDNRVIVTGGSRGYRGEHDSDIFECHSFNPKTGKLTSLAEPEVGRDYHSEAMLLGDGRIVTLGGNPLYANKGDTTPGGFEKRIEIYSPPYLYHGKRPAISGGPKQLTRGQAATFSTPDPSAIESANLLRPSAVTHVTDVEQRSIALTLTRKPGSITVNVPSSAGLVPSGWYMLFVANGQATPSKADWVHVG